MVTLVSRTMVVLHRPCKIDPTETMSPFNVPTPETVIIIIIILIIIIITF